MGKKRVYYGDIGQYAEGNIYNGQVTQLVRSNSLSEAERRVLLTDILTLRSHSDTTRQLLDCFAQAAYGNTSFKKLDDEQLQATQRYALLLKTLVNEQQQALAGCLLEKETLYAANDALMNQRCWICKLRKVGG